MVDETLNSSTESGRDDELTRVAAEASESVFARIWCNPEDDVYDAV
jgi:hypothetical protein